MGDALTDLAADREEPALFLRCVTDIVTGLLRLRSCESAPDGVDATLQQVRAACFEPP